MQTTKIADFPATNSNLVMKSTIKYIYSFFVPYSTSAFLLVPLSYSSFSNTYHICLYIFPHLLLLQATSNFLSPTLSSSIFLHVLLPEYYGVTGLFLLSVFHLSAYILFLLSIPSLLLSTTHLLITL